MELNLAGTRLYYEEQGSGQPVILLHAHSVDSDMWEPQMKMLSRHYRVIRYDLRGYGRSDLPGRGDTYRHVDDLRALMDALDVERAHIVGLSLGAMVALDLYGAYPERVLSAVCAASGLYADERIWHEDVAASPEREEAQPFDPQMYRAGWMALMLEHSGAGRRRIEAALAEMIDRWSLWQPRYERAKPLIGPPLVPLLRVVPTGLPLLVVIGGRDSEGSRLSSRRLLELIPWAQAARLPEAGHFANLEEPETFNRHLLAFLHQQ